MGNAQDSPNFVYLHPEGSGLPRSPASSAQYWTHVTISSYSEPLQGRRSFSSVFILSAQSCSGGTFGNTYQKLTTGLFYDQITLYLLWAVQTILTKINNIALFPTFICLALYSAIEWEYKTSGPYKYSNSVFGLISPPIKMLLHYLNRKHKLIPSTYLLFHLVNWFSELWSSQSSYCSFRMSNFT